MARLEREPLAPIERLHLSVQAAIDQAERDGVLPLVVMVELRRAVTPERWRMWGRFL